LNQLREALQLHFAPRRHSALLIAIIAAFAVRPMIGDSGGAAALFGVALVLLLLIALYNINVDELASAGGRETLRVQRRQIIGWALAIAAGVGRLSATLVLNKTLNLVETFCWLFFVLYVTVSELRGVLRQREVTGETICMAVSVYLLAGFTWTLLYAVMFQRHPESFAGLPTVKPGDLTNLQHVFPLFGYYSLGTISTIGGGDITPIGLQARYATVAEAITGQFYLAILVARLVGLQMSHSANRNTN
jgi:voltage-gated potassium channel